MNQEELLEKLRETFAGELEEHVRTLNASLLALERGSNGGEDRGEHLRALFRAAHSLKGAARSVGVQVVGSACHSLEDLFGALRDGAAELEADTYQLLFQAIDAIDDAGRRLRQGGDLDASPLATFLPRLEAVAATGPRSAPSPDARREAEPASARAAPAVVAPDARGAVESFETARQQPIPSEATGRATSSERTVRVATDKLDSLISWSGELLVARRRLSARKLDIDRLLDLLMPRLDECRKLQRMLRPGVDLDGPGRERMRQQVEAIGDSLERMGRQVASLRAAMRTDHLAIEQAAVPLDDAAREIRMLPFATACQGLDRLVRDLSQAQGKPAALVIEGGDVELDRQVLDGLKDPLIHLVRNAVDHGIESPGARRASGKAERATIRIAASVLGERVEIVVEDDGRGLDLDSLRARGQAMNLPLPEGEDELARLAFLPGLSTAREVTDVSGRGVGLDVVRSTVEARRGSVNVSSRPGQGTRFVLGLPLTLSVLRALLVADGNVTYAVDDASVVALQRADRDELRSIEGRQVLVTDAGHIPVAKLNSVLGLGNGSQVRDDDKLPVVILEANGRRAAFVVDELLADQDVTVKPLGPRLAGVRHAVGATVLEEGQVALILSARALVEDAFTAAVGATTLPAERSDAGAPRRRLVLADDSVTVRTLEKSILESAGYEVVAVVDGLEAWQLLQEIEPDLVVSDVEMPRMDGITLTEKIRSSQRLRALPVILVTALKSERDRMRGLEAGADAYIVKSAFDQSELIETIERLV